MTRPETAILVNTQACSGKAFNRWKAFEKSSPNLFLSPHTDINFVRNSNDLELTQSWVRKNLDRGVKKFIAAGGDGTLNVLLNLLIKNSQSVGISLEELALGAIGLGSSNDFHKPVNNKIAGFPCRINWEHTALKDIMFCSFRSPGRALKYFLINASIGITAQANHFFNFPPPWLARLKIINTNMAILCASLHAIFNYKNLKINLTINNNLTNSIFLTNLGAVKNKYFAGFLRYDQDAELQDNYFMLHLCKNMRTFEAIKTLIYLARGRFTGLSKTQSLLANNIFIQSDHLFCIELDGEVIRSQHCEIGIHHQKIRLCS